MVLKICVIGSGGSGLTSIKHCIEEGLEVVCYEKSNDIGGLWRYRDEVIKEETSVMKSTIINSSKEMSAFSDFPPPKSFPNYMHHTGMLNYLELYAHHFDLLNYIQFNHQVIEVKQENGNMDSFSVSKWLVEVKFWDNLSGNYLTKIEEFDAVMICTGHHVKPFEPSFPGQEKFKGQIMHSNVYKKADKFEDKKVVLVGSGNSAGDIAAELSHVSNKLYLSTRKGFWMVKRVWFKGVPNDLINITRYVNCLFNWIPRNVFNYCAEYIVNLHNFDHEKYGIKPNHGLFDKHPMINDALPDRILSGTVVIKNNIKEFAKNGVIFEGEDSITPCDIVILCTGYSIEFPFIDNKNIKWQNESDKQVTLYKHVFSPSLRHPETLAFIGLIQPLGPIFPVSELQSRWFVQVITGKLKLPSADQMLLDIQEKRRNINRRYEGEPRRTINVDWIPYSDELAELIGVKPNLVKYFLKDPKFWVTLYFGPSTPYQYRLEGDSELEAKQRILGLQSRVYGALNTRSKNIRKQNVGLKQNFKSIIFVIIIIFIYKLCQSIF